MDASTTSPEAGARPTTGRWKLATVVAGIAAAVAIGLATFAVVSDRDGNGSQSGPICSAMHAGSPHAAGDPADWCPWADDRMGNRMGNRMADSDVWMPNRPGRP